MAAIPNRDQERFDRDVERYGKRVLQVLAGLGIFTSLLLSIIALGNTGGSGSAPAPARPASTAPASSGGAGGGAGGGAPAPQQPTAAAKTIELKVIPEGKKGPEGKLHDAFTVTNFAVTVGQPLYLKIDNTDTVPHSITAPEAGVNIVVKPGTHTYKLVVYKPGRFEWHCIFPCDPWSMEHVGYMRGYITATQS